MRDLLNALFSYMTPQLATFFILASIFLVLSVAIPWLLTVTGNKPPQTRLKGDE